MSPQFKQISVDEARKIIDESHATIVDIRDPESYQAGHLQNAVSVNQNNIEEFLKTADKKSPLICYCYHGISSQGAAEYFCQNGFNEALSIEGGFEAWKSVYPVLKDNV